MPNCGIYQLICKVTHERYIGASTSISYRQENHFQLLRRGAHQNRRLQKAFDEHGEHQFLFLIIESWPDNEWDSRDEMYDRELGYLLSLKGHPSLLNLRLHRQFKQAGVLTSKPPAALPRLNVHITLAMQDFLRCQVGKQGITTSEYIRHLISADIENHDESSQIVPEAAA